MKNAHNKYNGSSGGARLSGTSYVIGIATGYPALDNSRRSLLIRFLAVGLLLSGGSPAMASHQRELAGDQGEGWVCTSVQIAPGMWNPGVNPGDPTVHRGVDRMVSGMLSNQLSALAKKSGRNIYTSTGEAKFVIRPSTRCSDKDTINVVVKYGPIKNGDPFRVEYALIRGNREYLQKHSDIDISKSQQYIGDNRNQVMISEDIKARSLEIYVLMASMQEW